MASNLLINNLSFLFSYIERSNHSPFPHYIEYAPPIKAHRVWSNPRNPLRILIENSNLSLTLLLCLYLSVSISSFIFSRTTHRLSPADQARCTKKRLAQYLCCACTHMYIFILFYIILYTFIHIRYFDIYFLIYCVLKIWKLFIQGASE